MRLMIICLILALILSIMNNYSLLLINAGLRRSVAELTASTSDVTSTLKDHMDAAAKLLASNNRLREVCEPLIAGAK